MDIIRKLKSALAHSGLTEKEIAFYVQVLKSPQCSVFDLAKKTGISKDVAYFIYESLEEKGLVASASEGRSKKVVPKNTDSFIENLYTQGRKFYKAGDSMKEVRSLMPYLSLSDNIGEMTAMQTENVGEEWVDLTYMDWDYVLAYGNYELLVERMGTDPDKEFRNNRLKRGKKAYPLVFNPGTYTRKMITDDAKELRKTKVLDTPELRNSFVAVFPDKNTVAIWSRDENAILTGVKVNNPVMTRMHERMFRHFNHLSKELSS